MSTAKTDDTEIANVKDNANEIAALQAYVVESTPVREVVRVDFSGVQLANTAVASLTQIQMSSGQIVPVLAMPTGELPSHVPAYLEAQRPVEQPAGIKIQHAGDTMFIVQREATTTALLCKIFLTFFAVLWNGIWLLLLLDSWLYFALPPTYIGWGLVYLVLCLWLNSKHIEVTNDTILVRVRPINLCNKEAVIFTNDVKKFRCKRDVKNGTEGPPRISYSIHLMDSFGEHKVILASLLTLEQAFFIQQELEKFFLPDNTASVEIV